MLRHGHPDLTGDERSILAASERRLSQFGAERGQDLRRVNINGVDSTIAPINGAN